MTRERFPFGCKLHGTNHITMHCPQRSWHGASRNEAASVGIILCYKPVSSMVKRGIRASDVMRSDVVTRLTPELLGSRVRFPA
jgi:hypothetical protein